MKKEDAVAKLTSLREPDEFKVFEIVTRNRQRWTVMNANWFAFNHRTLVVIDESKGHSDLILLNDIAEINVLEPAH